MIGRIRSPWLAGVFVAGVFLAHCVPAARTYPLQVPGERVPAISGSLSVEPIEGGEQLVVVQLRELPPPERLGAGLTEFVVWLKDPQGRDFKAGTLRYDRARQSGNLLATTQLKTFTVQITGERDGNVNAPSRVLLAERRVSIN